MVTSFEDVEPCEAYVLHIREDKTWQGGESERESSYSNVEKSLQSLSLSLFSCRADPSRFISRHHAFAKCVPHASMEIVRNGGVGGGDGIFQIIVASSIHSPFLPFICDLVSQPIKCTLLVLFPEEFDLI